MLFFVFSCIISCYFFVSLYVQSDSVIMTTSFLKFAKNYEDLSYPEMAEYKLCLSVPFCIDQ